MDSNQIKTIIEAYKQFYFTHDEPVPFKGHLKIYPVLVKDYYTFYTLIDIFTIEKNEDTTGKGITMSNLGYLLYLTGKDNPDGDVVARKIISMFELIFHIQNGIKCTCDEGNDTFMSYDDISKSFAQLEKQWHSEHEEGEEPSEFDLAMMLLNLRKCPKCGKDREDLIRYNTLENGKQDLIVDGVEITDEDFDVLRKVVCY